MRFFILANGFPLPLSAVRTGNQLHYDLDEALVAVERDIKSKTTMAEGYYLLLKQRDFLRNLLGKA